VKEFSVFHKKAKSPHSIEELFTCRPANWQPDLRGWTHRSTQNQPSITNDVINAKFRSIRKAIILRTAYRHGVMPCLMGRKGSENRLWMLHQITPLPFYECIMYIHSILVRMEVQQACNETDSLFSPLCLQIILSICTKIALHYPLLF